MKKLCRRRRRLSPCASQLSIRATPLRPDPKIYI